MNFPHPLLEPLHHAHDVGRHEKEVQHLVEQVPSEAGPCGARGILGSLQVPVVTQVVARDESALLIATQQAQVDLKGTVPRPLREYM